MRIRHSAACVAAIAAALVVTTALTQGASKNFVPDVIFNGSSLSGWRPLGDAKWRAENGEISPRPGGGGGWLILDKSYQDVAFCLRVPLRAGLQDGRPAARREDRRRRVEGHLRLAQSGGSRLVSRHARRPGQGDVAGASAARRRRPGPGCAAASAATGGDGPADAARRRARRARRRDAAAARRSRNARRHPVADCAALNEMQGRRVEHHRPRARCQHPAALPERRRRDQRRRRRGRVRRVRADRAATRAGPAKCGSRTSRTRTCSRESRRPKRCRASSGCRRSTSSTTRGGLTSPTSTRTASPDIVAGPYYYLGPDYNVAREIYIGGDDRSRAPGTSTALQFTYDFTGDGWPDVINSLFTQPTILYVNPQGRVAALGDATR